MSHLIRFVALTFVATALATPARAQAEGPTHTWSRGTELAASVGASFDENRADPSFGAIVGWKLARWIAVERRGSWYNRAESRYGFGADLGAVVNSSSLGRAIPYFGAGFGLYLESSDIPAESRGPDPALRLSAGFEVAVRRHVSFRPEVSALVVRHEGHNDLMPMVGIRIGYRFEEGPAAP